MAYSVFIADAIDTQAIDRLKQAGLSVTAPGEPSATPNVNSVGVASI